MFAIAGAAIVIAAVAGCSSKNSSTGSSNTAPIYTSTTAPFYTGPKRTVAQTPAPTHTCQPPATYGPTPGHPDISGCQYARPASPAPEAAQYKIIIDGKDITPSQYPGKVQCTKGQQGLPTGWTIETSASTASAIAEVSDTDPPQVVSVSVAEGGGAPQGHNWRWGGLSHGPTIPGDAEVSKSGKTYTFTGNLSPFYITSTTGSPVPFEFDATCP
jgi:hypothetical protein